MHNNNKPTMLEQFKNYKGIANSDYIVRKSNPHLKNNLTLLEYYNNSPKGLKNFKNFLNTMGTRYSVDTLLEHNKANLHLGAQFKSPTGFMIDASSLLNFDYDAFYQDLVKSSHGIRSNTPLFETEGTDGSFDI